DRQSLSNNFVNAIHQDGAGIFWIGTDGGLNRFDAGAGTFRLMPTDPDHPEAARVESIDLIVEDDEGQIWIGGWGDGVKRFDPETGRFTVYRHDSADADSLKTNFVTALLHDSAGVLWVGTDRGLHRFVPEIGGFRYYGQDEGLQVEGISTLTEDGSGNLWIASPGVLIKRDAETGTFAHHTIQEGVHGGSFTTAGCRLNRDGGGGEMLFGGADGVVVFEPEELWSNPYVPPVQFVALRQLPQGAPVALERALERTDRVSFSWPNQDFEFEFAALSYVYPESNQHAYMLEGYDQAWNVVGSNRVGRYTNLPGGTYTLRVKGSNNDGLWNERGAALTITIVPPIWETWWFRGSLALIVIAGLVGAYRLRIRSIEARTRALEEQVQARTRELATLNVVAQTASQSLDLEAMLAATLDKVLEVLGFASGAILLRDPGRDELEIACQRELSPALAQKIVGFYAQAVEPISGRPVIIDDASREPNVPQEVLTEGYRAVVSIPLASRGEVQGVLMAAGRRVRRFLKQDVDLLLSIGHQIGVAVENARLYEGTRDRLAQLSALQETSTAVASVLELDELLHLITEQATTLLKADGGMLNLVDWERDEDYVVAASGSTAWTVGIRSPLRASLSGWVTLHNQPVISNDVRADDRVDQAGRVRLEDRNKQPVANAAVAPLTVKGRVMGTLALIDKQKGQADFDQDDLDLLVAFANQAATAIENARLFRAEQRRAEQFRVISEVGQRITSFLDIDEILAHVTSLVQETFGYDHVGIALIEEGYAEYKVGAGEMWDRAGFEFKPKRLKVGAEGITGWVADRGEAKLVPDVRQDPHYVWMEGSQTRSELALPIKVKDEVVGVLDVQSNQVDAFDESDVAVLQSLADQAAVAIKNAQLFRAEQRRAEQFRVISEVGRRVTSILAIDELLTQMATLIREAFDYYHVGLGLIEGEEVVSKAEVGALAQAYQGVRLGVGQQGVWGQVAAGGEPVIVPDVSREPHFHAVPGTEGVRSHICVPLRTKEAVIGVMSAASDESNAFDDSDLVVLQSLADQAAIAVENIRLYEQAQQLAVIEERGRLARDLHDAVTQTLFSSSLIADALPDLWENNPEEGRQLLAELRQLSRGALAEMRTLLLELRPAALVETDLRHLLRQLGEATAGRTGLPVAVEAEEICPLPDDVHVALYRIAQEALNNTVKHARAGRVEICLRCLDGRTGIELSVRDDGRGFDPAEIAPDRLGLGILRERAQAIGAKLEITSQPGEGTRVEVVWRAPVGGGG
ncbi:MAG: GAF domain-containing protein, partial [Anaerolineae bacterium]